MSHECGSCPAPGNLVIKDVEKTDGGDYVCVAENMAGVKQSDVASLSVHGTYPIPRETVTAFRKFYPQIDYA